MLYSIARALIESYQAYQQGITAVIPRGDSEKAGKIISKTIMGNFAISLSAIQGPPGTGKTTTCLYAVRNVFDHGLEDQEIVSYIAPTNKLVYDTMRRTFLMLLEMGYSPTEILKMTRAYGSKIVAFNSNQELCILTQEFNIKDARDLLSKMRNPIHGEDLPNAVSYTHLTLPTTERV